MGRTGISKSLKGAFTSIMADTPKISTVAAKKLAAIGGDFMAVTSKEGMEIVRGIRSRRRKPEPKVKPVKVPKPPKEPKPPKVEGEKKPRKSRKKINVEITVEVEKDEESPEVEISVVESDRSDAGGDSEEDAAAE